MHVLTLVRHHASVIVGNKMKGRIPVKKPLRNSQIVQEQLDV